MFTRRDVANNNLDGTMPAALFEGLPSLREVDLSTNPKLVGSIPAAINQTELEVVYVSRACGLSVMWC